MFRRFGVVAAVTAVLAVGGTGTAYSTVAHNGPPGPPDTPVTDIAHRGASAYAPENTLAAVDAAANHDATTVEIDVQRSKDGELVLMHDTTLERTTDVEKVFPGEDSYEVDQFTLQELKELDAGSWFDPRFAGEPVPTLQEALDRLRTHDLNLLLEIKSPELHPGIESDLARDLTRNPEWLVPARPGGHQRLVIQSFDWDSVRSSHDRLPTVPHGLLGTVPEADLDKYAQWADMVNPNHESVDAEYVDAVHDAGMGMFVYTVNDPADMRSALDKGVDGLISDHPDVAREVIAEETEPGRFPERTDPASA